MNNKSLDEFLSEVVEPVRCIHAAFDMAMEMAEHYAMLTVALVDSVQPGPSRDWAAQCARAYAKTAYSWSRTASFLQRAQVVSVDVDEHEEDCGHPDCPIHGLKAKGVSEHGPN